MSKNTSKRKICSTVHFDNQLFKIDVGTVDKKNPETMYSVIGTYLTPLEDMDMKGSVRTMVSVGRRLMGNLLHGCEDFDDDFMFIHEIATERMAVGKKSYIEFQVFMKPKDSLLTVKGVKFKNIAENFMDKCLSQYVSLMEHHLNENGFALSKRNK